MSQPSQQTLLAMQKDPAVFRQHLLVDCPRGAIPLSSIENTFQRDSFAGTDGGWLRACGRSSTAGCSRAWIERPRGHSKTTDQAVMATFALFASVRRLSGIACAADSDQASLLRDAIAKLVSLNPWLAELLDVGKLKITNRHTGSELRIISSDAASSYGLTPNFVIADEVTHWGSRDLWDSLLSSCAKRSDSMLVAISNAGWVDSWQYELREKVRTSPGWYFNSLDGPQASWITPATLDEQRHLLPTIAFERLWLNRWASGSGDAIAASDLDSSLNLTGPSHPEPHTLYFAGLDIGLSRDSSALAIVGIHVGGTDRVARQSTKARDPVQAAMVEMGLLDAADEREYDEHHTQGTGRLKLADLHLWKPTRGTKLDLSTVESTIVAAHSRFNLAALCFDPWQCELLAQRATAAGVPCSPVPFTGPNCVAMASAVLENFAERRIDLYAHAQLVADLRALRVTEKSYGCRLTSPRGPDGHGDTATALALALLAARRFAGNVARHVTGELVCYP
ncbi:MAG: hypothetical protein JNM18_25180 [Planctomycetaceae bacterium]|nr:hypothetical protein [Planctomycetaceae bacterium]